MLRDIGPLGGRLKPYGTVSEREMEHAFRERVEAFMAAIAIPLTPIVLFVFTRIGILQ